MKDNNQEYLNLAESPYWKSRRTIRNFSAKEVNKDLIFNLIDKAAKAPTTGGMQLYSAIVSQSTEILAKLAPAHFNQPAAKNARMIITVVADFNRFEKWCVQRDAKPGFNNFESFTAAFLDAVIFAQQLTTLMEMEGLGVCWLGTATYTASTIGEILNLPKMTVPVAALAVGWPADEGVDAERLPTGSIIHNETYHDYSKDRIEEIFAEKEALESNKKFVTENNAKSLAHVFTDIRYPESNAVKFSEDFYNYIEKQGFTFPDNSNKR